ncbi:hypothetical protein M422DRAFT_25525 [Sphaerobolus stellatus SS14]|nr:hypothetical protein M422DRAFT_25525 [Sphaerobolus stellatus SS14]
MPASFREPPPSRESSSQTTATDMSLSGTTYPVCTTPDGVAATLSILQAAEYIVVDCEGENLGDRYGHLSIISIGAYGAAISESNIPHIFLYDAVELTPEGLGPILALLADPQIIKVMWDGRMDFTEIYHTYGTTIENVLDLQIAEIMSRGRRGETERKRMERLATFFRLKALQDAPEEYEQIQVVLGMQRCLEEHRLIRTPEEAKDPQMKGVFRTAAERWMERPLTPDLLDYAIKDIHLINIVYRHFLIQSYLSRINSILDASQRYVSINSDLRMKPSRLDCYRSSPVLPLDILEEPKGILYECEGCRRMLSVVCFQHTLWKRQRMCRVCRVVGVRKGRAVVDIKEKDGWVSIETP